jgi:hypothetical protein
LCYKRRADGVSQRIVDPRSSDQSFERNYGGAPWGVGVRTFRRRFVVARIRWVGVCNSIRVGGNQQMNARIEVAGISAPTRFEVFPWFWGITRPWRVGATS